MFQKFNLDKLAQQICEVFKRTTGYNSGHVHFLYKGKQDQLIVICHNGELKEIVAKNKECGKGECIDWELSEFAVFSPKEAFLRLFAQVDKIIIDDSRFRKTWDSSGDFLTWLNERSKIDLSVTK